jgi:hypothetical protein
MPEAPWHPLSEVKALVAADKFDLAVTSATKRILSLICSIAPSKESAASREP